MVRQVGQVVQQVCRELAPAKFPAQHFDGSGEFGVRLGILESTLQSKPDLVRPDLAEVEVRGHSRRAIAIRFVALGLVPRQRAIEKALQRLQGGSFAGRPGGRRPAAQSTVGRSPSACSDSDAGQLSGPAMRSGAGREVSTRMQGAADRQNAENDRNGASPLRRTFEGSTSSRALWPKLRGRT